MPNIFSYLNYRLFLRAFYAEKKKENPRYSYRVFNKIAGIVSPSFVKLVIDGKRNLSTETIDKFCRALNLTKREAKFFTLLVHLNQAKTVEERNHCFNKLTHFKECQSVTEFSPHQYEFYSQWYHVAILEMAHSKKFRTDPAWIAKSVSPPITVKQAEATLKSLKSLGLLALDKNRRLRPTKKVLSTPPEVFELGVTNFHQTMIRLAEHALLSKPGAARDISSITVALDEAAFEEAKQRIQEFRRELNVILSRVKDPTHVYQINFQLFPLTSFPWKKEHA